MKKVKITVLRKEFYPELADEYLTDGKEVGSCPLLNVGAEFIFEGSAKMPEGFCPWAWIDAYRSISSMSYGSTVIRKALVQQKSIMYNGGVLENEVMIDGIVEQRFWIDIG